MVGITGNIGCGKSTLSKFLKLKGFKVFDADEIGKSLLQEEAKGKVVKEFGREILREDGSIDTKRLGRIVFSDSSALSRLTSIVHPLILQKLDGIKRKHSGDVVFVEAAVLVEYGWQSHFDSVVVVFAYRGQRILRAARRFGIRGALKRDSFQLPYSEKLKYADYLICNTGTLLHLKEQSELLSEEILRC